MSTAIFWFRRDLSLDDNVGLYHSLKNHDVVIPIFIFDEIILSDLKEKSLQYTLDKRLIFIYDALVKIHHELQIVGSALQLYHGKPLTVFNQIIQNHTKIDAVYTNHDYEPYAIQRDEQVASFLKNQQIVFHSFKNQVIFEKGEVLKDDYSPYKVFTPFSKKWKDSLQNIDIKIHDIKAFNQKFLNSSNNLSINLQDIGFQYKKLNFPLINIDDNILIDYVKQRDFPAIKGTSNLSVHLRFGTISIRKLLLKALKINANTFINELIWREFFMMILYHYPNVVHQSFKLEYDKICWRNNENEFLAWCNGQTGYPIVDAGMRELNETGLMHNRVRMITASFLCKHLLIDWRLGEAYFAKKLLDYELAANNGNWQWVAGTGVDAAPYFRIFNPTAQAKKFDPKLVYIKKWISELNALEYPTPIVEHNFARQRCIETYKRYLQS